MKNRWGISATTNQSLAVKPKDIRVPKGTMTALPCEDCGAKIGEQCVAASGKRTQYHPRRKHQCMQAYLAILN